MRQQASCQLFHRHGLEAWSPVERRCHGGRPANLGGQSEIVTKAEPEYRIVPGGIPFPPGTMLRRKNKRILKRKKDQIVVQ